MGMSQASFCKAVIKQAIRGNNQKWFAGNNAPLSYGFVQSILNWLPQDGLQAYKKRQQIKQILNHTLTQQELYIISQLNNITDTAKQLNKPYTTIRAAKLRLQEIL